MKVFEVAGIIFNADNVCTIQKVNIKKAKEDGEEFAPGIQITTVAGGVNFTYDSVEERDKNFATFLEGIEKL